MIRDSGQFGSFDGLDNRRTVMELFCKMSLRVPESVGRARRQKFLERLIAFSDNGFADKMVEVTPCDPVTAYHLFVAITGCLGVNIEKAAKLLEEEVRSYDRGAPLRCS